MSFPNHRFDDVGGFADAYVSQLEMGAKSLDRVRLRQAADILIDTHRKGCAVFSCGNGGSAAIANHLACDHTKGVRTDTDLTPRVISLSNNVEIITAISNDIAFDEVFAFQLQALGKPGDALITISSSGDSENIVRAAQWAVANEVRVISMTGLAGGRSAAIADVNLHVESNNYGVIEDVHQSMMHILAQFIRQAHMDEETVKNRSF